VVSSVTPSPPLPSALNPKADTPMYVLLTVVRGADDWIPCPSVLRPNAQRQVSEYGNPKAPEMQPQKVWPGFNLTTS
jgi:hypothetical protein